MSYSAAQVDGAMLVHLCKEHACLISLDGALLIMAEVVCRDCILLGIRPLRSYDCASTLHRLR